MRTDHWKITLISVIVLFTVCTVVAAAQVNIIAGSGSAATTSYTVVDTGQDKCYNATGEVTCPAAGASFYGQDAQLTRNASSYNLGADQLAQLLAMRTDLLGDLAFPSGAYLYSQAIAMPTIPSSDFLFTIP